MALNKWVIILFVLIMPLAARSQVNRYMVFFKDKPAGIYSVDQPLQYLSQRAIDRRLKQGISVTQQDIPVHEEYVTAVKNAGAEVFFRTRWMNGLLVQCNASLINTIKALPMVDRVEFVAPNAKLLNGRTKAPLRIKEAKASDATATQLAMVGINNMHADGYHGEGMLLGIFDSGFTGVDITTPYQSINAENRINKIVSHDFVYNTSSVFQYDDHGAEVFSVIAARQEGVFTGGAYQANYLLFVTEDVATEYRVEEYNWLFAAEVADSAGVDVINSSLGYNTFDDASMNYTHASLDGKTAVITQAAQWLADRGVVVVCSAGNEGSSSWQRITAPADATDVLAVASVTASGIRVLSSSKGPTADNRIKPDVAALGSNTVVILPNGSVGSASGTSLASPIIASLVAGVWQRYPSLTNKEVMDIIRKSASQAQVPDNLLGYGVPNYGSIADLLLKLAENPFSVYPNPVRDTLLIKPYSAVEVTSCQVEVISENGQLLFTNTYNFSPTKPAAALDLSGQASGIYVIRIHWDNQVGVHTIVKN